MVLVNPPSGALGQTHAILRGIGRRHYVPEFPGPLSIKSVVRGSASWTVNGTRMECGKSSYLILNQDQPYTIEVDAAEPVETFCLFFSRDFVPSRGFRECLRPKADRAAALLEQLRKGADAPAGPGWMEDQVQRLAESLVTERIPAARNATREHIYRCLLRGRERIDATLAEPARVEDAAREAAMAPFHFHRLFREAFGETPHQYKTRRRLEAAAALLERTDRSVTEICMDAGFQSLGSFSALFQRTHGLSPRAFRELRKIREAFYPGPGPQSKA